MLRISRLAGFLLLHHHHIHLQHSFCKCYLRARSIITLYCWIRFAANNRPLDKHFALLPTKKDYDLSISICHRYFWTSNFEIAQDWRNEKDRLQMLSLNFTCEAVLRGVLSALHSQVKCYKLQVFPKQTCSPFLALEFLQLKVVQDFTIFFDDLFVLRWGYLRFPQVSVQ